MTEMFATLGTGKSGSGESLICEPSSASDVEGSGADGWVPTRTKVVMEVPDGVITTLEATAKCGPLGDCACVVWGN